MDSNQEDLFDRLPDALLLSIFNQLLDAKTLIRCLSVSRRFASQVSQIDNVFLPLPRLEPIQKPTKGFPVRVFKTLVDRLIIKPIRFLHHIVSSKQATNAKPNHFLYYSPFEVLRNFGEIRTLHLELPWLGVDLGFSGSDSLLKWKAEFGEELKSCVILGATSFQRKEREEEEEEEQELQPRLPEEGIQSRIIWTISCLVSASMRHYLVKQVLGKLPKLQSVVVTDASKQGKLCMVEEQIVELRNSMKNSSEKLESPLDRTPIPNLSMKVWYVPEMEFPASGWVMKGLTLALIKPASGVKGERISEHDLLLGDLDGEDAEERAVLGEAMREIVKKKMTFVMEMSSF